MSASPIEMPGRSFPVLSLAEAPLPNAGGERRQRNSYGDALAALAQVVALSPVLPASATVVVRSFAPLAPRLELHLESLEDVEAFGQFFDAYVTSAPVGGAADDRVKAIAEGEFLGVPFEAWALSAPAVAS
jgi:hypothetical protein